MTLSSN